MNLDIVNYGVKSFAEGLPAIAIAKEVDKEAAKTFCMVRVNGEAKEMFYQPQDGDKLEFLTFDDPEGAHAFWHSSAHIMAQAIQQLFRCV